jgi:hypothetical protein
MLVFPLLDETMIATLLAPISASFDSLKPLVDRNNLPDRHVCFESTLGSRGRCLWSPILLDGICCYLHNWNTHLRIEHTVVDLTSWEIYTGIWVWHNAVSRILH